MARYTRNAVEGTPDEARSGWAARRQKARAKRSGRTMDRAEIAAIRAAHLAATQDAAERGFNPEVQTAAPAADDYVAALSDADLVALYKQLHDGRAPAPKAKRPTIERAVRAKQAERAAIEEASAEDQGADEDDAEETVEGDEQ